MLDAATGGGDVNCVWDFMSRADRSPAAAGLPILPEQNWPPARPNSIRKPA
jgi:hypothetical protein